MSIKKQHRTIIAIFVIGCAVVISLPLLWPGRVSTSQQVPGPQGLVLSNQSQKVVVVNATDDVAEYGLLPGDVITHVDAVDVKSIADVRLQLRKKKPGDSIFLVVTRGDEERKIIKKYERPIEIRDWILAFIATAGL